jgi:hypothetical protein
MNIRHFFELIGADANPPTNELEIGCAEERINGKLPTLLREWYLQANGSSGEARILHWRFPSLNRLHTIEQRFPTAHVVTVMHPNGQKRQCLGENYAIFCDQLIYAPFYAVNIAATDTYYGEVIAAYDEDPSDALLSASSFEKFARYLMEHYSESLPILNAEDTL